jgi:hypothetical protein
MSSAGGSNSPDFRKKRTKSEQDLRAYWTQRYIKHDRKGGGAISKRITIKGVRRQELDYDAISYVLFVMAKRQVEERRRREAEERRKQQEKRS